ncbi:MAG: metal-dependent transcriptional regulator [Thermoplasmatales archaeon]
MKHNAEDYLMAIWELGECYKFVSEKGVAERLGISLPSAWEGIHRLEREKQLTVSKLGLKFTNKGFIKAMQMVRAHRITEQFVYSYLEVPWEEVHDAVMDLEHDFPDQLLTNLYKKMGSPGYCPHGNPIRPDQKMIEISASEAPEGSYYLVRQVLEEHSFLKKLRDSGSMPGKRVRLEKGESGLYLIGQNGDLKMPIHMGNTIRLMPKKLPASSRKNYFDRGSLSAGKNLEPLE